MKPDLNHIVKDILLVAGAIDSLWKRNKTTWGKKSDADRIRQIVDMDALLRLIDYLVQREHSFKGILRGYRAAQRLDVVLRTIELHKTELETRLRAA